MKITDLYKKYLIMPNLALHQLRVAAVGKYICDHIKDDVNSDEVISALLVHDMGNIIKFDLSVFPEFCEPEDLEYWEKIRQDYIEKYGKDEHQAHLKIAREIGISKNIIELIDGIEFTKILDHSKHSSLEQKICSYADLRVGPHGILSLAERLADGRKRYHIQPDQERWDIIEAAKTMESQIFEHADIAPSDISDEAIESLVENLRSVEIASLETFPGNSGINS